ncbi:phage distal tail protein, Rcc01695 family [Hyphomicrobium sp. 2TAF46]|uniref:phage distal tail protein, Rcc01695 family n=1 Tax=Hyphomicrobium sp. 2TAF46 TaxID=3233019 RepID=UPI003F90A931
MSFHDVRFPTAISRNAQGGPERRTDVVVLGSGYEERNSRWADSRRSYNAGYGVKSLADLAEIIAFFEERRGRLHAFRWRDPMDWKSCAPNAAPAALDQVIGTGNGAQAAFQLKKVYGRAFAPWKRDIKKPIAATVKIAVAGAEKTAGTHFALDASTGIVTFLAGHIPASGQSVTAGFEFDVPVRFDTDKLEINLSGFTSGAIPNIPIVEVRL